LSEWLETTLAARQQVLIEQEADTKRQEQQLREQVQQMNQQVRYLRFNRPLYMMLIGQG
jgi:hypothetical protein